MSIAITDDHRTLAQTASDFLLKNGARGAARDLLEAESEGLPAFWPDVAGLGWLGLHIPEEYGGSGFGLSELVIVAEELGRAVAPGPFVPTVAASAVIASTASADLRARLLPGLVDGSSVGSVALGGTVEVRDGVAHGSAGVVLSGGSGRRGAGAGGGGRGRRRPISDRRDGGGPGQPRPDPALWLGSPWRKHRWRSFPVPVRSSST